MAQTSNVASTMADYRQLTDTELAEILRPLFELLRGDPVEVCDHHQAAFVDSFLTDVYHTTRVQVYDEILRTYNQGAGLDKVLMCNQGALVNLGIKRGPKYNPPMTTRQQREEEEELRSVLEQQDLDFSSVGNNTGSSSSQ